MKDQETLLVSVTAGVIVFLFLFIGFLIEDHRQVQERRRKRLHTSKQSRVSIPKKQRCL